MLQNKLIFTATLATILFFSCNSPTSNTANKEAIDTDKVAKLSSGFQLLENNCFSCHNPNSKQVSKIAPNMAAIKLAYLQNKETKSDFIQNFITFLNAPSKENSKMPELIQQYGVMPKMNVTNEQITQVASYIYDSKLEEEGWFENKYQEEKIKFSSKKEQSPLATGKEIAMKTKGVLGKNLLGAIKNKGTKGALTFCSTQAIPLTDSMSNTLNAFIKRVSDKNRNPNNGANKNELTYIKQAKLQLERGESIKPQLLNLNNKNIGYYPILTNEMCLQCHGDTKLNIERETLDKIHSLYPNDLAVGYKKNELRGIWVIEMP